MVRSKLFTRKQVPATREHNVEYLAQLADILEYLVQLADIYQHM